MKALEIGGGLIVKLGRGQFLTEPSKVSPFFSRQDTIGKCGLDHGNELVERVSRPEFSVIRKPEIKKIQLCIVD